jgi:hypothetical protein
MKNKTLITLLILLTEVIIEETDPSFSYEDLK